MQVFDSSQETGAGSEQSERTPVNPFNAALNWKKEWGAKDLSGMDWSVMDWSTNRLAEMAHVVNGFIAELHGSPLYNRFGFPVMDALTKAVGCLENMTHVMEHTHTVEHAGQKERASGHSPNVSDGVQEPTETVHDTQSEQAEFLKSGEYRMAQQTVTAAHDAIFHTMEHIQNTNPELADQLFRVIENLERFQTRLRMKGLSKMPSQAKIDAANEE